MQLKRFLEEFGHRAVYEADIMNPRWSEDPGYILEQVRQYIGEAELSPRTSARALREQAESEVRRLTLWRRPLIRWLVRRLGQGMAQREAAKSAMGATVEPARRVYLEIGRRLAEAGSLGQPADIFHLSSYEIQSYLLNEWDGRGARELAEDRRAQRERWLTLHPPDVIVSDGRSCRHEERPQLDRGSDSPGWSGIGVSAGQARGACRIVLHPAEGSNLKRGDILVAPSTDPGWTPLFLRAAGIVMETGGYLSHGAIVAREYGIPAVVNIPGVLEKVRNVDRLLVNGDLGIVKAIE